MNAGGLNPHGAREAVARAFKEKGFKAKIAVVTGDSISDRIDELQAAARRSPTWTPAPTSQSVRERLLFANAYLGAAPIAEALAQGADIVITGRVADAALSLGPIMHELNWRWDDWEKLAQGLTVGHLLECSGQASGGNFGSAGEWAKVQNFLHLGYPIAEVSEDGSALLTKAPGTGGRVSFDTLRQQLLYEVHNPHAYFSPDVVLDMGTLNFDDKGDDACASPARAARSVPTRSRSSPGYHDGWMGLGQIGFSWPDAYLKCETAANIIKGLVEERGWKLDDINIEYMGYNALLGANADASQRDNLNECFLRMTVRTKDRRIAEGFSRLFPWLGLSGPPYAGGLRGSRALARVARPVADAGAPRCDRAARRDRRRGGRMKVGLWKIAHARSGDKADRADIGLFAYDAPTYEVLKREVTRERLAAHFADICKGPVEIYPLDNLLAMKIVLNAALQGRRCALAAHGQSRQGGRGAIAAHGNRGARRSAPARARMSEAKRKPRLRRNNESNRREELLRVSAKLFREKGFDGTSIRDISSAAGMHSGSPFYHFKTKQDILVAVMEQGLAEGLRKTEEVMALPLPPEQKLKGLIRAQLGTILEEGNDFIPVLLYDWRSLSAANRRRIVALKDRYDALWQQVIDELQRAGHTPGDAQLVRLLILGAVNWTGPVVSWRRTALAR